MIKKLLLLPLFGLALFGAGCVGAGIGVQGDTLGGSESGASWVVYDQFQGYRTDVDPSKVPDGAAPMGQNTTSNDSDRISIRPFGTEVFPSTVDASTTSTPITSLHTFRSRNGENVMLRASSSTLEWFDRGNATWETLQSGLLSDDFGFADVSYANEDYNYVYFGNALDPFSRWNGAHTRLNGALAGGEATITVDSTEGFNSTSGTIIYCGVEQTYNSKTNTVFTLNGTASACADNEGVAQAVEQFDASTYPRGNIYLFSDNRLWVAGATSTPERLAFSGYGSSTQWDLDTLVTTSTEADPSFFNLAEGGGKITALAQDEGTIYAFKRSIIYRIALTDFFYSVAPLKTFDNKSQTVGAVSKRSTFTGGNAVFFVTPDNQIMMLSRVEEIDYPQVQPISETISHTVEGMSFASSTGATFQNQAYFSARSSVDGTFNDTMLVYDIRNGTWFTPVVGLSGSDFAIYDDGEGDDLYFGDSITQNVYKFISDTTDANFDIKSSWRTKQYTFGLPHGLKTIENVFVEGYISENTDLTVSLLLDEDGFTQTYTTEIDGSNETYIFDTSEFNVFGLSAFGTERFGSNEDLTGVRKFRVYLGKNFRQVPFYSAQLEFGSEGQSQKWEVSGYGFYVRPLPVPEKRELYKEFN